MTKNVLILVPDLNKPGGVTNYFVSLKGEFNSWQPAYFVRGSRKNTPKPLIPAVILMDYLKYYSTLISGKHDVIHVNVSLGKRNLARDPLFVTLAKSLNKRVLLFMHGWDKECEQLSDQRTIQALLKADKIVVLAEEFKQSILSWGYKGEVYVRPTVVARSLEERITPADIEKKFTSPSPLRILFLSRIEEKKGIRLALETFSILQKEFPELQLDVAGDGSDLEISKAFVTENNIPNVNFLGYVTGEAKISAISNAHLYFFPTQYGEGMPISVLEAMMCGLPVVTRPMGGLADFFTSEMGFISDSTDAEVFANAISPLLSSPEKLKAIGTFNYNYAREHFTVDRTIRDLEEIYDEIVSE